MARRRVATKRKKIELPTGIVHVHTTFNNTIISVSDESGNVKLWSSAGALGFKGAKKSTPYAAQLVAQALIGELKNAGTKTVTIRIKGTGPGKSSVQRAFQASDIEVVAVHNVTPKPHNGVKKKKKFRRR